MDNNFEKYNEISELLKVLAHPVRICIIRGLLEKGRCNVSTMQHCLDIPQPTVSTHLQKLKAAGIIEGERKGLEVSYKLCSDKVVQLINLLFED
ncbi:ArsR/SmtB family transcription factor [Clostridium brassicae]|uniref:Metalloregulator ArsR/SmtB family transcription factor n=1 Tax=Clostridium brassicae TaxID=2999072 RepID=A0ABT4DHD3_9CLOT|nr:metalloregulator ArsR/SmtB family transcription factor [Clostridium brassicae]MCY6960424.1 metalloregulator ArsR/SmtB family transcription factor [Clostridium brassicae]